MANLFVLVMQEGPDLGQRSELEKNSVLIGRDPASDIVVDDVEVSRRHARLIAQSGGYTIEDLGSTNGTFVNEKRIRTITPLQPGANIRLGELIKFTYEIVPPDESETREFASTPPSASQRVAARSVARQVTPAPATMAPVEPAFIEPVVEVEPEPADATPAPARLRRARRGGIRLPIFSRPWMIGGGALLLLGICGLTAFLWYVDANFLWCDVFGGLIPACIP
jgi:predicted component of type VI protein secretion system